MKDDSFDCTLIAHLRIFLLFYRLLYCLILPENRLFFGIWKVVEIEVAYEPNETMQREYCCKNPDTNARYRQLQRNIIAYLKNNED